MARDKSYFADENLSVTWSPVAQGGVAIEAVFGGSAEIGASAIFETMVARGNGLDLMFLAAGVHIHNHPPDNSALLVRTDGSVRSAADLVGKKVSAGLINSVNYVHMLAWLEKRGVDPKKIEFLEIPFPQMADALFQKRVDAVWNVEPFVTFMTQSGNAKVLAYPYLDNIPGHGHFQLLCQGKLDQGAILTWRCASSAPSTVRQRISPNVKRGAGQLGVKIYRHEA